MLYKGPSQLGLGAKRGGDRQTDLLRKQGFRNTLTHGVRNGKMKYSDREDCHNLSCVQRDKANSA